MAVDLKGFVQNQAAVKDLPKCPYCTDGHIEYYINIDGYACNRCKSDITEIEYEKLTASP